MFSCRELRSNRQYLEKRKAELSSKRDHHKPGSRRWPYRRHPARLAQTGRRR